MNWLVQVNLKEIPISDKLQQIDDLQKELTQQKTSDLIIQIKKKNIHNTVLTKKEHRTQKEMKQGKASTLPQEPLLSSPSSNSQFLSHLTSGSGDTPIIISCHASPEDNESTVFVLMIKMTKLTIKRNKDFYMNNVQKHHQRVVFANNRNNRRDFEISLPLYFLSKDI